MAANPREWPLADAKAKFSALVDHAEKHGPQIVTRRGRPAAVLLPIRDYERLLGKAPERSAIDWLLAPEARIERLPGPDRRAYKWRAPPKL